MTRNSSMSLKDILTMGTAVSITYIAPIFAAIFSLFLCLEKKETKYQCGYFRHSFGGVFGKLIRIWIRK